MNFSPRSHVPPEFQFALFSLLALLMVLPRALVAQSSAPDVVDVFLPASDGYPAIRIPSLVTTQSGVVLAFAEGRQGGRAAIIRKMTLF